MPVALGVSSLLGGTVAVPLTIGASFTATTVVVSGTVAAEIAVVLPFVDTSDDAEKATGLFDVFEPSIRRTVSPPGVPFHCGSGTNRSDAVDGRIRAVASPRPVRGTGTQVVPSVVYCHTPCAAVDAFAVIAIPASVFADEPPATVSRVSSNRGVNRLDTVWPAGVVSSLIDGNVAVPVATGASFTGSTVRETVSIADE